MGDPAPAISIAVVSWNTRALLERALVALGPDIAAGRAEVWVVDNASADGSAEAAARHPGVQVEALEENVGFGAAVDRVAARTRAPWIACANADTAVTPGALEALRAAGDADRGIGALAPRLLLPDGSAQHSVHAFPTFATMAAFNSGVGRLRPRTARRLALPGFWDPDEERDVDWALGAFLLIRREAFERVGGFGAGRWMFGEDVDLGWRLARAGYRTRYVPRAVVRHDESAATTLAWGDARHERRMQATYAWLVERRGASHAAATGAASMAGALARGLLPPAPRRLQHALNEVRLHGRGLRRAWIESRR